MQSIYCVERLNPHSDLATTRDADAIGGVFVIIDARALTADHTLESDLCIIGAGVVGISLAMELRASGFNVCLLESGGTEAESQIQNLCRGDNIGLDYYPLDTARVRQFGGSSHKWLLDLGQDQQGARLRLMSAIDFEKRDWVPYSGWPFDKAHLDPYYDRALDLCQVREKSWEPGDWETTDVSRRFPFAFGRVTSGIYHTVDRRVFCRDYPEQLGKAPNVTVVLHAPALEILTNESGTRATRVRACDPQGKEFSVTAQRFVMAAGGLETPRLLLLCQTQPTKTAWATTTIWSAVFSWNIHTFGREESSPTIEAFSTGPLITRSTAFATRASSPSSH